MQTKELLNISKYLTDNLIFATDSCKIYFDFIVIFS